MGRKVTTCSNWKNGTLDISTSAMAALRPLFRIIDRQLDELKADMAFVDVIRRLRVVSTKSQSSKLITMLKSSRLSNHLLYRKAARAPSPIRTSTRSPMLFLCALPRLSRTKTIWRRSNRHSASSVLIVPRGIPRFPPWRFVQRLPADVGGQASVFAVRQASNKP